MPTSSVLLWEPLTLFFRFHLGDGLQGMLGGYCECIKGGGDGLQSMLGGYHNCIKGGGDGPQGMLGVYFDSIKGGGKAFSL